MNALDIVIIVVLLLYAVRGMRRGLVLGMADLAGLIIVLVISFAGYRGIAPVLERLAPLRDEVAQVVAFFILVLVASALYSLISYPFLLALRPAGKLARRSRLVRLLGLGPGLVHGAVMAGLLSTALALLPLNGSLAAQAEESVLASQLRRATALLAPRMERFVSLGQQQPVLRVEVPGTGPRTKLNFPRNLRLSPDPGAERKMLQLINRDRAREGLQPLVMDAELVQVARAHSEEMFRLSYFSHESRRTGTPQDRLDCNNISYLVAGENLAYQPNVVTAHRELMNSPGHRKNIMSLLYKRVGIGVIKGGLYGQMFTQEFTD